MPYPYLAFTIASVAATLSILLKYASPDKFGCMAYFFHGITFMFSFVMMGLLATDLAFTLRHRHSQDEESQKQLNYAMDILWQVVYWGNLLFGSLFNKFFQFYWVSGHFSIGSRIKFTLKKLLIRIIICLVVLTVLIIVGYTWLKDQFKIVAFATILIMSNVYGTLLLVVLLSYGLALMPFSVWNRSNNSQMVFEKLMDAEQIYSEFKDARQEFTKEVSICRNLVSAHRNGFNQQYMDVLAEEIPSEDLDGMTIFSHDYFRMDLREGRQVDEEIIATRRYALKHKLFIYRRKKARWLSLYRNVDGMIKHPIIFEQTYLTRKIETNIDHFGDDFIQNAEMAVQIKKKHCCLRLFFQSLAVFCIMWSIFILYNETMLIFGNAGGAFRKIDEDLHL